MKKLVLSVLMLAAIATFAGVAEPFKQFTRTDYVTEQRPADINASQGTTQNGDWFASQLISLKVPGNSDVYLTHKVESWFTSTDLDGVEFDMLGGDQRYGYIFKSDFNGDLTFEKGTYDDLIHWSDGTTLVTYVNDLNENIKTIRTGYFIDHFDKDTEIYLVLTTLATDTNPQEAVDSYQYVQSDNHGETTLMSRVFGTDDLAGNVVINFGIDTGAYGDGNGTGREFVAVYDRGTTGGPLPGLLPVCLLGFGTVFGASKMKKQKRA